MMMDVETWCCGGCGVDGSSRRSARRQQSSARIRYRRSPITYALHKCATTTYPYPAHKAAFLTYRTSNYATGRDTDGQDGRIVHESLWVRLSLQVSSRNGYKYTESKNGITVVDSEVGKIYYIYLIFIS